MTDSLQVQGAELTSSKLLSRLRKKFDAYLSWKSGSASAKVSTKCAASFPFGITSLVGIISATDIYKVQKKLRMFGHL